jgi:hypothetical protein
MTLRNLFVTTAVIGFVFGLGYLLVPGPIMQFFGTSTNASGELAARFFGGSTLGLALIAWQARDRGGDVAQEIIIPAFTVVFVLGLVLSLLGTITGLFSSVGWLVVLSFLGLAASFAYFQFGRPASRPER